MATGRLPDPNSAPVTAKGDLYTYSTVPAKLAVGNNGETLVADSSATTGLRWQGSAAAGKNIVLNGAFDIWQRGTSITMSATAYSADRWQAYRGVAGGTVSRQATSDTTNLPFITYCARVQRDSGNTSTSTIWFSQAIESQVAKPLSGKAVVLSFYARAGANYSAASSALNVRLRWGTGTDQNPLGTWTGGGFTVSSSATLTTTWQRFTFTGTVDATSNELAAYVGFDGVGTAGAADYFEITGVQLEAASVATPFQTATGTLAGELAACQRYYVRKTADSSALYATFGTSIATSTTGHWWQVPLPVQMRVTPTSMDYSTIRIQNINNGYPETGGLTLSASNSHSLIAVGSGGVASGLTSGNFYWLGANNSSTAYIGFSAEL